MHYRYLLLWSDKAEEGPELHVLTECNTKEVTVVTQQLFRLIFFLSRLDCIGKPNVVKPVAVEVVED